MKTDKFNSFLFFTIFFLTFLGYYALLLVLFNLGMSETSQIVTIPIRLLICACLTLLLIKIQFSSSRDSHNKKLIYLFLLFAFFYVARLFVEYITNENYYMSSIQVLLYFISFAFIPFIVLVKAQLNDRIIDEIFRAFFWGGFMFSILVLYYYSKFIGQVVRLTPETAGEEVLSPLALSYSSSLVIGVFAFFLLKNKTSFTKKIFLIGTIILALIPFFLGASRGSVIALAVPFLLYFFFRKGVNFKIRALLVSGLAMSGLVYLDSYLKSGLLDRFLGISKAIETGASSASRLDIWKNSLKQFANNPIWGDKLRVEGSENYPHNLFVEVLQTTGMLGFIPFLLLVIMAWRKVFYILKFHKNYFWLTLIFIQAFFMNMFSGAIYTAGWFWTGMALLFSLAYKLRHKPKLFYNS